MRERLLPRRRIVPYPKGCLCAARGAEECRAHDNLRARQNGGDLKPEGACGCPCHTLDPSPWDWDDMEDEE